MPQPAARLRLVALRLAGRLPWPLWWPLVLPAVLVLAAVPNQPTRRWARNFATLTGTTPTRLDVARGLWSWARNTISSLQLAHWTPAQLERRAVMAPDDWQRLSRAMAEGGAVVGLPHSGSWDLAGAWVCRRGMPVSTVAEELADEEFALFVDLRQRLGFTVYGHRDPRVLRHLVADVADGRVVCLLADRDFSRHGIPVVWDTGSGPQPATMPAGPAQVALRSGATLLGVAGHYEGPRMRLVVSEALVADEQDTTHRARLATMTQGLCDFFAGQLRAHPHDWHMLQPFFGPER